MTWCIVSKWCKATGKKGQCKQGGSKHISYLQRVTATSLDRNSNMSILTEFMEKKIKAKNVK